VSDNARKWQYEFLTGDHQREPIETAGHQYPESMYEMRRRMAGGGTFRVPMPIVTVPDRGSSNIPRKE
jgi:hypothetical protein